MASAKLHRLTSSLAIWLVATRLGACMREADAAMYDAKRAGRSCYRFAHTRNK